MEREGAGRGREGGGREEEGGGSYMKVPHNAGVSVTDNRTPHTDNNQ